MPMNEEVHGRLQPLSDRKLRVWQDMAERWPAGSTAPINADAFLSLVVEVKRQRAELTRLTDRLEAADALLREAIEWNWLDDDAPRPDVMDVLDQRIQAHLSEPRT